ncbi:hypothetical protein ThidrDRAFT_3007 [Thiorhodococcus drewsii AZ1]|uniref:Uncharacterized protein n=1 Tax=Thiorhodococcus drewsii AZ1 TaxID=765913 RepID=G2E3Z4_9GAMM|nr:hypothetical protein [Thiorhodococcus drewsii]EGV29887.1 hypothetical protein ThidrDRAFT_3007 [Thiorhodococcus drewsii AZ1]
MATPSALAMLENHGVDPLSLLQRHVRVTGDLTAEGIARSPYRSPIDAEIAAFVARLDADLRGSISRNEQPSPNSMAV